MSTRTEDEVQLVFAQWAHRNTAEVPYEEVKRRLADKGMSVNQMVEEIDWEHFTLLMMDASSDINDDDIMDCRGADAET